jgi:hypothetical protein
MTISRTSAIVVLVGCSCGAAAFKNYIPRRIPLPAAGATATHHPSSWRRSISGERLRLLTLRASLDQSGDRPELVSSSRRAVLQHCASIFATTAFAWIEGRNAANASEFSSGFDDPPQRLILSSNDNDLPHPNEAAILPINPPVEQPQVQPQTASTQKQDLARESSPPEEMQQYASESVPRDLQQNTAQEQIISSAIMPASTTSVTQVTLENSQVVTIPTKQVPIAFPTQSSKAVSVAVPPVIKSANANPSPKQPNSGIALAVELSITTAVLGAVVKTVYGQMTSNTDDLTARAKVVLVENEPYGLSKGRRYYNGIDITRNEAIPASDVLKYCDAGKINNDCAELITDFLGEVQSNSRRGLDSPSMRQKETATAVLSYLDTLSSSREASSNTAAAFSSYLNGLSNGDIDAPASPEFVADYLESLNGDQNGIMPSDSNSEQFQGDMTRLIETYLISNDGYGEEENVSGKKYEPANGVRMQLERVP